MEYNEKYKPAKTVYVIKKDGTKVPFDVQKVINAVQKSAFRAMVTFSDEEKENICKYVIKRVDDSGNTEIHIPLMHNIVEGALESVHPEVAKSYRDYRNYKQDFIHMLDDV